MWYVVYSTELARGLLVHASDTLENILTTVSDDYAMDRSTFDVEMTYLPSDWVGTAEHTPVTVTNDRQVRYLLSKCKPGVSTHVCVTFKLREDIGVAPSQCSTQNRIDLNEEPQFSFDEDDNYDSSQELPNVCVSKSLDAESFSSETECDVADGLDDDDDEVVPETLVENSVVIDCIKESQQFKDKRDMQTTLELCAMKYNFDYRVTRSNKRFWCIRCKVISCNWRLRAERLDGSTIYRINKYVGKHTCAPSKKTDGSFAFVVYDSQSSSVFSALSSDGGESLYWGISADGSVVMSDDLQIIKQGYARSFAPFPTGCMFHSETGLKSFEHPTKQMKAMQRIDSEGVLCGAHFKVDACSNLNSIPRVESESN